ncbi:MAG: VOC family protein, partial [Candidatus Hodarchaeales archaeon]
QTDCIIFKHDNFLFGFCSRNEVSSGWLMTFFYESKEKVDQIYQILKDYAIEKPILNKKYNIYHFFAKDPEGRDLEFQVFLHDLDFNWEIYD